MRIVTRLIIPAVFAALVACASLSGAASAGSSVASSCTPAPPPVDPALPAVLPPIVTYPTPSSTEVTKTGATLLATIDTNGVEGQASFELTSDGGTVRCTALRSLAAVSGPQPVTAQLRSEKPGTTIRFRADVTTAGGQVAGADQSFTTIAPLTRLAAGTTIFGVRVGFLTPAAAETKVRARFTRPATFTYRGKRWQATPAQLGAEADVSGAVERVLAGAGGGRTVALSVSVDAGKLAHYVAYVDGLFSRPAVVGSVKGVGRRAELVEPQTAIAVQADRLGRIITRTLRSAKRPAIEVPVTETQPQGPGALIIVVRLGEQSLTMYKDGAVVLETPVTTGRPALPTPVGSYDIAWRRSPYTFISPWPKGNPYYYDPAHVRWAMFFYDNDFLHDSYEPAGAYGKGSNFGPYASHGCVHVPADVMQQLYKGVPDHTPLIVVDA